MSNSTEGASRFIEDMASLLMPWGVPAGPARLYGYLLLCEAPASLDVIVADLKVSKSSASVAARLLEQYGLVRRRGSRGSRRILYEASENFAGMIDAQNRLLAAMAGRLSGGVAAVDSPVVRQRLERMAGFYQQTSEALAAALRLTSPR